MPKRNASLARLVDAGFLSDGQRLILKDYGGAPIPGYDAIVENGRLLWEERTYSMSALARMGFESIGSATKSFRGPAHWHTADEYDESIQHMQTRCSPE